MKKQRGITLIALVITIIVLLILAGVSIAMLTGNNGILSQAQKASEETKIAEEKEQIGLAWNGATAVKQAQGAITASDIESQLSQNGVTNAEVSGDIVVKFEDEDGTSRWYKLENVGTITGPYKSEEEVPTATTLVDMFKKAQTDGCAGGETCTNPEEHLHIGDYVSYNPIATGDDGTEEKYKYESLSSKNGYTNLEKQVYTVNNDTEKVNWIVLGLSEDGNNLLITSGSPVRKEGTNTPSSDNPYLYLKGSTGYINAEDELTNISKIYGNGDFAEGARSITVEDVNKLTGYNPETDYTEEDGNIGEYGNEVTVKGNGDGTYSYSGANGVKGTFTANHSTNGFSYIEKESNQLKKIGTTDATTEAKLKSGYYYYDAIEMVNENIYNKFFDPTGYKYYWLTSRAVRVGSGWTGFLVRYVHGGRVDAYDLFDSDGNVDAHDLFDSRLLVVVNYYGVRPVVALKSDVTIEDIQKIGEQQEPTWE